MWSKGPKALLLSINMAAKVCPNFDCFEMDFALFDFLDELIDMFFLYIGGLDIGMCPDNFILAVPDFHPRCEVVKGLVDCWFFCVVCSQPWQSGTASVVSASGVDGVEPMPMII